MADRAVQRLHVSWVPVAVGVDDDGSAPSAAGTLRLQESVEGTLTVTLLTGPGVNGVAPIAPNRYAQRFTVPSAQP